MSDGESIIQLLLEAGADVNARNQDGNTPLHLVAGRHHFRQQSSLAVAQSLISHGAEISALNNSGKSPLAIALETNTEDSRELASHLVQLSANIEGLQERLENPPPNPREEKENIMKAILDNPNTISSPVLHSLLSNLSLIEEQ